MSFGDWRNKLAFGLAVAGLAIWLLVVGFAVFPIPRLEYKPEQYAAETEREEGREEADTRAQVWMAHAAWWQVGVGLFGLLGLGAAVVFAGLAWSETRRAAYQAKRGADEARRQADAAEAQLKESRMPHLFVDIPRWNVAPETMLSATLRIRCLSEHSAVLIGGRVTVTFAPTLGFFQRQPEVTDNPIDFTNQVLTVESKILRFDEPFEKEFSRLDPLFFSTEEFQRMRPGIAPHVFGWFRFADGRGETYEQDFLFFFGHSTIANASRWIDVRTGPPRRISLNEINRIIG